MAEPKQQIQTFLNPANQMFYFQIRPIKRPVENNEISTYSFVMLATSESAINCQIVRKFCNGGKFITLNVFNCKRYDQKNSSLRFCLNSYNIIDFDTFFTKQISLLLSVLVSIYTQLSVVITVKFTTQLSEKTIAFTDSAAVHFGV